MNDISDIFITVVFVCVFAGIESFSYDPQRFAMDYHIIGFRECAAEVARYLVTIEGMDIQDPLRLRLMSHLQYFVQQRELSAKSCASPGGWTTTSASSGYQPNCASTPYQSYPGAATAHPGINPTYVPTPIHAYPTLSTSPSSTSHLLPQQLQQQHLQQQQQQLQQQQQQQQSAPVQVNRASSANGSVPGEAIPTISHSTGQQNPQQQQQQPHSTHQTQPTAPHVQQPTVSHESHHQQQQQQQPPTQAQPQPQHYTQEHTHTDQGVTYADLSNSQVHIDHRNASTGITAPGLSYTGATHYPVASAQEYNSNYVAANGSKPYRPWGAEMAY